MSTTPKLPKEIQDLKLDQEAPAQAARTHQAPLLRTVELEAGKAALRRNSNSPTSSPSLASRLPRLRFGASGTAAGQVRTASGSPRPQTCRRPRGRVEQCGEVHQERSHHCSRPSMQDDSWTSRSRTPGSGSQRRRCPNLFETFGGSPKTRPPSKYGDDVRLGLPLAFRYCQLMGGKLTVQSQRSDGSDGHRDVAEAPRGVDAEPTILAGDGAPGLQAA